MRHIVVRKSDTLVINGYEVSGEMLKMLLNPASRQLWAFIAKDGRLQPTPYDETHVIWLTPSDLERVDAT